VAIVSGIGEFLKSIFVLELGAIVHGDALEGPLGKTANELAEGRDGGGGCLSDRLGDDFIAGLSFRQDKRSLSLTS